MREKPQETPFRRDNAVNLPPKTPMRIRPEEILEQELETAKKELRPVSRRELAEKIGNRFEMPYKDAIAVVDTFCDEHAPAVPEYLSKEFGIFWLKVVAVANVVVAFVLFYNAVRLQKLKQVFQWPLWCVGVLFIGFAIFCWVKSLEKEAGFID